MSDRTTQPESSEDGLSAGELEVLAHKRVSLLESAIEEYAQATRDKARAEDRWNIAQATVTHRVRDVRDITLQRIKRKATDDA